MSASPTYDSILARVREGDEEALAELFSLYRPRLKKIVSFRMDRHLRARVDPSDVLQEAFLTLASRMPEFREKEMSFFIWLRLVTVERLLKLHREHITTKKRDARRDLSIDHQLGSDATSMSIAVALLANNSSVADRVSRQEQQAALLKLMGEMDAVDREVIALRIFEDLPNREAAEVLGLTKQAASKRFVRAMRRLRESMIEIPGLAEHFGNP